MDYNFLTHLGKVLWQVVWDFIYFPLWWYSAGLLRIIKKIRNFYRHQEESLALSIWLRNIFTPMYGQHDFAGRLISFIIRFVQVIFRGFLMLLNIFFGLVFLTFYLLLPPAVLLGIWKQIF